MKYVYGLTLGEALCIVNKYELTSKEEAQCFLDVHIKLRSETKKKNYCFDGFYNNVKQDLVQYEMALENLEKNNPAYPVLEEIVEGCKTMYLKVNKCIELLN